MLTEVEGWSVKPAVYWLILFGVLLAGVVSACGLWDFEYGLPLASHIVRLATKSAYES